MIRRRKTMPKRKQQLQNSPQLEQLLNALPTLAFEPELVDLSMDKARLMELMKNDQTEPDILIKFPVGFDIFRKSNSLLCNSKNIF